MVFGAPNECPEWHPEAAMLELHRSEPNGQEMLEVSRHGGTMQNTVTDLLEQVYKYESL